MNRGNVRLAVAYASRKSASDFAIAMKRGCFCSSANLLDVESDMRVKPLNRDCSPSCYTLILRAAFDETFAVMSLMIWWHRLPAGENDEAPAGSRCHSKGSEQSALCITRELSSRESPYSRLKGSNADEMFPDSPNRFRDER